MKMVTTNGSWWWYNIIIVLWLHLNNILNINAIIPPPSYNNNFTVLYEDNNNNNSSIFNESTTYQEPLLKPLSSASAAAAAAAAVGTSQSTSESTIPQICTRGIQQNFGNNDDNNNQNNHNYDNENFIEIIEGDAVISILTKDPITALFIGQRINQIHLINGDFIFGMRIINMNNILIPENILLQEVEYLQLCLEHSIGILIDYNIYQLLENIINDLEYNIWPIPSTLNYILPKVTHLLYEMPWLNQQIASVEILTDNLNIYNQFMDIAKLTNLCLMHFRSSNNIYIFLGNNNNNNQLILKNLQENGTIFIIPIGRTDKSFLSDLPNNSYILMESEVELKNINNNINNNTTLLLLDNKLYNKNILTSELLTIGGQLLDLINWLNDTINEKCEHNNNGIIYFETCYDYLNYLSDWNYNINTKKYQPIEILNKLQISNLKNSMTFEMLQKIITNNNNNKLISKNDPNIIHNNVELKEIASQNFITNLTTYFHYNNNTIHQLEYIKFGQIFNCQYNNNNNNNNNNNTLKTININGMNNNYQYPYLINNDNSVMSWHFKSQLWIPAGLTASILGILISLAILIFIIIRITIGDVFEGNPISTIGLLISLIILFLTIIPFTIEYQTEKLNSQLTLYDIYKLNTLCSIRIFLLTISYCITFSILLCRSIMLASIGNEGGFLSHINGYIQTIIFILSSLIQIGLSVQLLILMNINHTNITSHTTNNINNNLNLLLNCNDIYYGIWLWILLIYDIILLIFLVILTPLIYRSQRNYREGILMVIGIILCLIIWCLWIPMSFYNYEWHDAAIPLGIQGTGWSILIGILIPRSFLIVRGIERSDIAQTLPSLTSLAFAQNHQYPSEQSVYECVNPAMRYSASREDGMGEISINNHNNDNRRQQNNQSPSEMPTLPLRGAGPRRSIFQNMRNNNSSVARRPSYASSQSSMPPSPQKITRF